MCGQVVWALGNIIGDGPELRDLAIQLGIVSPLLALVKPKIPIELLRNVVWVISNLCRNKNPPPPVQVMKQILPVLCKLIHNRDNAVLEDVVWSLGYMSDEGNENIQMVIDSGVVPHLVLLLSHSGRVQTAALRAIGNVVTGSEKQTQFVLDNNALTHFPFLLSHHIDNIRKEALWFSSNVLAGSQKQIQAVINARLLPKIIESLSDKDCKIPKEAAWCVKNLAVGGNKNQVAALVQAGTIPPFCGLLGSKDVEIVKVSGNIFYLKR